MNWSRWFYKATAGVEDFVESADDDEVGLNPKQAINPLANYP